ncbi:TonB family protein [Alistipes putredinis]|uniref:TonB family protein n=1 Tax=Alistipes putredinis TaxID=28117 RepID=UPI003A946921
MKKFLFYAVSLLLVLPAMAQTPADAPGTTTSTPPAEGLVIADGQVARLKKAPSFKNKGFEKYWKWVLSRVQYPADMEEQKVEGVVQVRIIVETDGSVTVDEVLASPHEKLTEAVTRVVENSPKWTPGIMTDKESGLDYPVRVSYVLPVEFKVRPPKLVDPTIGRYNGQKNFKPYGS